MTDLDISRAWLVDPAAGREGPGDIVVRDGILESVVWLDTADADGIDDRGVVVAPGFVDLHAHFREPGNEDAETIASGLAAAAHGGFTTVCVMPNTTPALDDPAVLARVRDAAQASGSPVRLLAYGAVTAGRGRGDAGRPWRAGRRRRRRLLGRWIAGRIGGAGPERADVRRVARLADSSSMPRTPPQTDGAEANDGFVSTVLGLRGWPAAAEEAAVARDLAILAEVVRDVPAARLHLTHVSTAGVARPGPAGQGGGPAGHVRRHATSSRAH